MKSVCQVAAAFLVSANSLVYGDIVSWHTASGVLPSDPTIPVESRFQIDGQATYLSMQSGFINVNDTSDPLRVGVSKSDVDPIASNAEWAFEIELRTNSHSRPLFDYGATTGIDDVSKRVRLVITRDAVGFGRDDGLGFLDDLSFPIDTVSDFHVFRVTKSNGGVNLFADSFASPVLSLPYSSFDAAGPSKVWLLDTSNPGVANFDVRRFAYNLDGTNVPEPSTALSLVLSVLLLASQYRRNRRCDLL